MEMYILEERLDRIEDMLRFIVDSTIANGISEVIKTDDKMTDECRDNLIKTSEVLTDSAARFMNKYLDKYFEINDAFENKD